MKTIPSEETVTRSSRSPNRSAAERSRFLRNREGSGLAAEAFAKLRPVNAQILYRWRMEERSAKPASAEVPNRWDALEEWLRHGHTHLDTNALERLFRDGAFDKKNWMFVGHPQAGEKGAIIYTLLSCCKIHDINPDAYLSSVLDQLVAADGRPAPRRLSKNRPKPSSFPCLRLGGGFPDEYAATRASLVVSLAAA